MIDFVSAVGAVAKDKSWQLKVRVMRLPLVSEVAEDLSHVDSLTISKLRALEDGDQDEVDKLATMTRKSWI